MKKIDDSEARPFEYIAPPPLQWQPEEKGRRAAKRPGSRKGQEGNIALPEPGQNRPWHWSHEDDREQADRQRNLRKHIQWKFFHDDSYSAETWERFGGWLFLWREQLQEACETYLKHTPPSNSPEDLWMRKRFLKLYRWDGTEDQKGYWKTWTALTGRTDSTQHEKEGAPWIREAWECSFDLSAVILQRQARWMWKVHDGPWVQLGTVQNRLHALALLENAFLFDALPEASHGHQFWQDTKNGRLRHHRAVLKTRKRAHEALRQVDAHLHEYWLALVDAQQDQRKRGILRFGGFDPNGVDEEYEYLIAEVSKVSRELKNLTQGLKQFEDPILSEKEDRGRKDKGALATASFGLEKLFLDCGVSTRRQALRYTHALLYVAGLWPDEKLSGLQAKASDLRKRLSSSIHDG